MKFYAGVEGGSTSTKMVIMNQYGVLVSGCETIGSNISNLGIEKVALIINELLISAKINANIPVDIPIESLGLGLSGAESPYIKTKIEQLMMEKYCSCAKRVVVDNDLIASGLTCVGINGKVHILISGTGSNSGIVSNGKMIKNCGGRGYLLGERGSAYWLASKALSIIVWFLDGYSSKYDKLFLFDNIIKSARQFFGFNDASDLVNIVYQDFTTDKIAAFTAKIAELADANDGLSMKLFSKLGTHLALHLNAIIGNSQTTDVTVLCIGLVWMSWNHMKDGFISTIKLRGYVKRMKLVKLKYTSAVGAILLAAPEVPYDLSNNVDIIFEITF